MPRNARFSFVAVAVVALAAVVVAGCGDKSKSDKTKPAAVPLSCDLKLTVVGKGKSAKFDKKTLNCKQGTVKLTVVNPPGSAGKHGVGINGGGYKNVAGVPVKPGRQSSLTVQLKPGTYAFFDPANKSSKGTLVVVKK